MLLSSEVILPGAEGQIKAGYDTKHRHGSFNKTIKVYSNDPQHSMITLRIKGEIKVKNKDAEKKPKLKFIEKK